MGADDSEVEVVEREKKGNDTLNFLGDTAHGEQDSGGLV
jgi:hypothetical protein